MCRNGEWSQSECLACQGLTGPNDCSQAVERRGDRDGALSLFDDAVRLAPENALVRYRRAKILVSMRKYKASDYAVILRFNSSRSTAFPGGGRRPRIPPEHNAGRVERCVPTRKSVSADG